MANIRVDRGILFGKNAKYTYWGLRGCSHGMYSRGGFDFYVYGIKGILNIIIDKRWGDMAIGVRRF